MDKTDTIIEELGLMLADCDHVTWPKSLLKHWIHESQGLIANVAKHRNTEIVEVDLVQGSIQSLPSGYEEFVSIPEMSDGSLSDQNNSSKIGNRFEAVEIVKCTDGASSSVTMGSSSSATYELSAWSAEPMSASTFYVVPPVPSGFTGTISVLATKTVSESDDAEIAAWAHPMVVNWVMYRALGVEIESESSATRSARYLDDFYKLLSIFAPPQPKVNQIVQSPQG